MSYILDALRRADSEKAPGTVPGLHSQPTAASETPVPRRRRTRPLVWILGGGAIGLLATLTLWFVTRPPSPSPATIGAAAPSANSPTVANPAAPLAATPAAPAASAPAANPTASVASAPATPAEPVGGAADSARAGTADPMAPVAPPAPWPSPKSAAGNTAAAAPGAAPGTQPPAKAAAQAQPQIVLRDDLPANLKSELPPLAVGGSMYSSVAANRTLILDGRLVRENERLTPELVLEEIRLKSAVLRYKGQRFEIRY